MPTNPGPPPARVPAGRPGPGGPTADDLRKRAHARLAERVDIGRSRHKPVSLLRQEARRVLDLFLDIEVPGWPKPDRDRFVEEVIGEVLGLGPLDELFRDEAVREIMVLAYNQVIARKGDVWLPTSVHFRDADHYRQTLARLTEAAETVCPGPQPAAAVDVRLANGFRAVAVFPPAVLDQPPVAVFARGVPIAAPPLAGLKPASGVVPAPAPRFGVLDSPAPGRSSSSIDIGGPLSGKYKAPDAGGPSSGRHKTADPAGPPSGRLRPPAPATPPPTGSGVVSFNPAGSGTVSANTSTRMIDPLSRVRQRITERLSVQMASAGVYDIARIPPAELQKVVAMSVQEFCAQEKLGYDAATCDQLVLEILAAIQR